MKKATILFSMLFGLSFTLLADRYGDPTPPAADGVQPSGSSTFVSGSYVPWAVYTASATCLNVTSCSNLGSSAYVGIEATCSYNNQVIGVQYSANIAALGCSRMKISMDAGNEAYWLHSKGLIQNYDTLSWKIRNWYYWTNCDSGGTMQDYYDEDATCAP